MKRSEESHSQETGEAPAPPPPPDPVAQRIADDSRTHAYTVLVQCTGTGEVLYYSTGTVELQLCVLNHDVRVTGMNYVN